MKRALVLIGALAAQAAAVLAIAATAQAAPQHVGVVVRYSNGSVSAGCATAGGDGLQVLEQKHSVTMGTQQYSGFVLRVDGVGTPRPDNTHYWSYWHSAGHGGWTYASAGASSYTPPAGSVEGWSYVNGQGSAPRPPSYTYSALCGNLDPRPAPSPTSKPMSKPTPRPTTSAAQPRHHHVAPTTASVARAVPTTSPPSHRRAPATRPSTARRPTSARTTPRHPSSTPARTTSVPTSSPRPATTTSTSTPSPSPSPSPVAQGVPDTGGFPAWGTLLALVVVGGLVTTAAVVMRRRSG